MRDSRLFVEAIEYKEATCRPNHADRGDMRFEWRRDRHRLLCNKGL